MPPHPVETEIASAATVLAHDVPTLVREGVNLARLEAKETVKEVGLRAGLIGGGLFAASLGFAFLCMGIAFLVSEALQRAWAGPTIVGTAVMAVGFAALSVAAKAGGKKRAAARAG
jgi:membrane-bound ClpP family serine protease